MRIAVLSGKGGAGKTLIAVNLAAAAGRSAYVDCDVEAPNGHLFFKPTHIKKSEVAIKVPILNPLLCNGCRACVDFCRFNALAYIKETVVVFNDVCHSCGGCVYVCPQNALSEREIPVGTIQSGFSKGVSVYTGELKIGMPSGVPIIKKLLDAKDLKQEVYTVVDCPPGSACTVMESIKDADYCVVVAEATAFGLHDMKMVLELVRLMGKPHGVILNKWIEGEASELTETCCREEEVKLLGKIPFDSTLGTLNSNGEIVARVDDTYRAMFSALFETIKEEVKG